MRIFISAGEPSGDLHGANLIRELRNRHHNIEIVGYGGDKMKAAGCTLLYPLCQLAVMWLSRVLIRIHVFLGLISKTDRFFRHHRPDAVILIDYPGFNWWVARRARFHGIPVFYFVPPQLWAWMGWRVRKMHHFVDHVLCTLPFEQEWYAKRGVAAHYVGHPFFDEIKNQQQNDSFIIQQRRSNEPIIGLLPGSRDQEVQRNLSTLIRAAVAVRSQRSDARFVTACFRQDHKEYIDQYLYTKGLDWIETCVGRTTEIIGLSHSLIAVSGSVSLELMQAHKPAVIVYRITKAAMLACQLLKTSPYICLVNLLAGKELYPEYLCDSNEALSVARHILTWLNCEDSYARVVDELHDLNERVAQPGACANAAEFVLGKLKSFRQVA